VPLFVKLPGQKQGAVSDRSVESVDLLPTVAEVVGGRLPGEVAGVSVLTDAREERREVAFYQGLRPGKLPLEVVDKSRSPADIEATFGRTPEDTFRIGPCPELIGRPIEGLVAEDEMAAGVLELTRNSPTIETPPDRPVPCYFEGVFRPTANQAILPPIAVAINGVIEAVARPSSLTSIRGRWDSLVPERSLKPGANAARFFVVDQRAEGVVLIPCATRQVTPQVLPIAGT